MYDCYLLTYEPLSRAKPSIHYQTGEQLSTTVQFSFTSVPQLLTINFQFNKPALSGSVFFLHPPFYMVFTSTSCHRTKHFLVESHRLSDCISVPHHVFLVPLAETFFVPSPCFNVPLTYTPLFSALLNIQY